MSEVVAKSIHVSDLEAKEEGFSTKSIRGYDDDIPKIGLRTSDKELSLKLIHDQHEADAGSNLSFYAGIAAIFSAGLALILLSIAVLKRTGYRTGIDILNKESTYHYVTQMSGYFALVHAIVSHRVYHSLGRRIRVGIHAGSHICCMILLIAGIALRIVAKNTCPTSQGLYEPNLYTLHSFLALSTMAVYLPMIMFSIFVFRRIKTVKLFDMAVEPHSEVGKALLAVFTTVVTAGVQQLFTRGGGCVPPYTTTPDTNPASSYGGLAADCQLLNGAGMMVYIASVLAAMTVSISASNVSLVYEGLNEE